MHLIFLLFTNYHSPHKSKVFRAWTRQPDQYVFNPCICVIYIYNIYVSKNYLFILFTFSAFSALVTYALFCVSLFGEYGHVLLYKHGQP